MTDDTHDLTTSEREALARLDRTMPIAPAEEERTVRALRAAGLLGPRRRRWPRPLGVALAIAAGLACFFAGLWSERSGVWGRRDDSASAPAAAAAAAAAQTPAALANAQVSAPVIRF